MAWNPELQPRRRPEQARSRARVEAILVAARQLLAERGVDHVSMTDIAASADMSKAAVYRYFPTKRAVIRELAIQSREEDRRLVEEVLSTDSSDHDSVFVRALRAYCDEMIADPYYVQLSAAVRADVELARLDRDDNRHAAVRIATYLEPDAPEVRKALELRLLLVFGLLDGLMQVVVGVEPAEVEPLVDAFVRSSVGLIQEVRS